MSVTAAFRIRTFVGVVFTATTMLFCPILDGGKLTAQASEFFKLAGHGGPVKGIDVSKNSDAILTASFDYSVGSWIDAGPEWFEGHNAAVNVVKYIDARTAVSGGDDAELRIWDLESGTSQRLSGHRGKIMGLDVSPDGRHVASASWDGTIGIWNLEGEFPPRFLADTGTAVNDVAFSADGSTVYSASRDGKIRQWNVRTGSVIRKMTRHGFGINMLIVNETEGWLAYGAVDGGTRVIDLETAEVLADLTLDRRPILAMALSPDRSRLAVGDGDGFIMVVDTADWTIVKDFRAAKRGPVWALEFSLDGGSIYAGGIDDSMFAWPLDSVDQIELMAEGERTFLIDPEQMNNGERQFNRKCSICHTLTGDSARRAGPTLAEVFGRKAGAVEGYNYTTALESLGITWSEETIGALFDLGPDVYVPGTKMPMQRITRKQDRDDLIAFLKVATATVGDR